MQLNPPASALRTTGALPASLKSPQVRAAIAVLTEADRPLAVFNEHHECIEAGAYLDPRARSGEVVMDYLVQDAAEPGAAIDYKALRETREDLLLDWAGLFWAAGWGVQEYREGCPNDVERLTRIILTPPGVRAEGRYPLAAALAAAEIAGPSEGDKLCAALRAYGVPAFLQRYAGASHVLVAVDRTDDLADADAGLRLVISSDEYADRAATAHDEPWSVQLYTPADDFEGQVFRAPEGLTPVEESAVTAWAVARWLDKEGPVLLARHPRPATVPA
ncbi:hypothetical protein EV284_6392 [Streptomyces sp. BK022]|uniref:hypothetical protein n=1 Tax=Streptomyces sp. BK022 TaxID=2512123 RepID=UPI001029E4A4|nr:hypothetical protein [Streptomyces sp. BK022]RZU28226.1 hypothetical protein EV284_6392 [Streptomyces sp. BK022]